jgi:desulfoferrodoxin-like iron-binding protein
MYGGYGRRIWLSNCEILKWRMNMATKVGQKYKCNICGNEVVVTNAGEGELVCCGQPMDRIGEGFECK